MATPTRPWPARWRPVKLGIPVAHVEAGLRSFNRSHARGAQPRADGPLRGSLLFCPTQTALELLAAEGVTAGVHLVGDVMIDALRQHASLARQRSGILARLGLSAQGYLLATVHRPYNTDASDNLRSILAAFDDIWRQTGRPVILPLHPRTLASNWLRSASSRAGQTSRLIPPLGYLDMLGAAAGMRALILTDSGGIQKEAYAFAVNAMHHPATGNGMGRNGAELDGTCSPGGGVTPSSRP
jgi:UDP-GlcNAc3NAcA epimerase